MIPMMDHINEMLTTQSCNASFKPSIQATLSITKKTLNSYYDQTDYSKVYHIVMGAFYFDFDVY